MTTTSRERREAVAKAITDARLRIAGNDTRNMALVLADAACATCLPDRVQFLGLLDDLVCSATEYGNATPNSEREARAAYEASEARDALITLVYGADDAQAGDQEGAEHE